MDSREEVVFVPRNEEERILCPSTGLVTPEGLDMAKNAYSTTDGNNHLYKLDTAYNLAAQGTALALPPIPPYFRPQITLITQMGRGEAPPPTPPHLEKRKMGRGERL